MDKDNKVMMQVIHEFSESLTEPQLETFVDIVESFSVLLDTANKDTKKAYKLYEKAFVQPPRELHNEKNIMH